jgi:hypothetical protein
VAPSSGVGGQRVDLKKRRKEEKEKEKVLSTHTHKDIYTICREKGEQYTMP